MDIDELYDLAILIGRFQPFHKAHAALLDAALKMAGRVLVVLGSAGCARNTRNPFTWKERAAMIGACLAADAAARVTFVPVRDYYDDRRWAAAVVDAVRTQGKNPRHVALVGFHKDATSDYLRLFPDWSFVPLERQGAIDATTIRQAYFDTGLEAPQPLLFKARLSKALARCLDAWLQRQGETEPAAIRRMYFGDGTPDLKAGLPEAVVRYLDDWSRQPSYATLQTDYRAVEDYQRKWGVGPFVTVDALVSAANHVLLIRRGRPPGQGLWALPGGFLEGRERLLQGAIRELKEETRLDVSDAELEDALCGTAVFDHPDRSPRARIITHAHHFALPRERPPAVEGADDAAEAHWLPLAKIPSLEAECFEDHFHILAHFLALEDHGS
jgi:bifunctional NMN adenylyltransferase/nudix hydrolase